MKNKRRAILCLALILAMLFSLAACGKKGDESEKENGGEETPAYVYTAEFRELRRDGGDSGYINARVQTDEGFYATVWEKIGEREIPEDAVIEYEGQYDIYGSSLYFLGFDGTLRPLENYEPLPIPEDTEGRTAYNGMTDLSGLLLRDDGKLISIEVVSENWYDGDEADMYGEDSWMNWNYVSEYYLRVLEQDGTEISRSRIDTDAVNADYLNFYSSQLDDRGNILCTADMYIVAVAEDGSVDYIIESDDYVDNLIQLRDGRIGVTRWGSAGMELVLIDTEKGALGEAIALPNNAYNLLPGNGEYDLIYRNGSNLFGFDIETGANDKILNFINCDINGDQLDRVCVDDEGTVTGILSQWNDDNQTRTVEFVTLTQVPYDSVPHKESITMAVLYTDYELTNRIIDFNRHSSDVRIELQDYSEYNTDEDYGAGRTKLLTELMSGDMPDLFVLTQMPFNQLAAKGLLEDLDPWLDSDPELKRSDFFPTVLSAMETDGKLYRICPNYQIQTLIGASTVVGDTPGWTYDEFRSALASMPEGCDALDQYMTRSDVLQLLVYLDMEDFVNWNTGEVHFDSQEFIDLLSFANSFQVEFDWENYDWSQEESTQNRIAAGRQMLMNQSIYNIDSVMYNDLYFGGDCTYIGWPTNSGVGSMFNFTEASYGMSANCAHKEAAWSFLRSFLTEEYQENVWGIPVNIHAFETQLKQAMTPEYMTDADGNYLLDENGERRQYSRGGMGMSDGSVYEIYAMTQEQADKLMELIEVTTRAADYDESIYEIVNEQAQAYFAGQKSAEEVARLIQSKANLYVNEQR